MELNVWDEVGFIFKTYNEVAQLEIYIPEKLGEGGTIYHQEHTFTIGDKSKVKKWQEVIKGNAFIYSITKGNDIPILHLTINSIRNNTCSQYEFEATPVEIICKETNNKYETITKYDSIGFKSTTNFFHHLNINHPPM